MIAASSKHREEQVAADQSTVEVFLFINEAVLLSLLPKVRATG